MNSSQFLRHKLISSIQSGLLVISMAVILGTLGWLLGGYSLAFFSVGLVVMLYFFNPVLSPLIVLKMLRARRLAYREAPRLYDALQSLCARAGLNGVPALFYFPNDTMNAFTLGAPGNAVIAVSASLLRRLNSREIAGVLAHEVSHIRHNDIRIMSFANLLSSLIRMLSLFGQFLLLLNLPLLLLGEYTISWMVILLLIFAPSISAFLQLALSRAREYSADLGAAELTGDPASLASALAKIENYQNGFFRRIFFPNYSRTPIEPLLRTHPPTKERIERLLEIQSHHNDLQWNSLYRNLIGFGRI